MWADYALPVLFILCTGVILIMWHNEKRKGNKTPFPWREFFIFTLTIAVAITHYIRDGV
jgi:hypothetical protein